MWWWMQAVYERLTIWWSQVVLCCHCRVSLKSIKAALCMMYSHLCYISILELRKLGFPSCMCYTTLYCISKCDTLWDKHGQVDVLLWKDVHVDGRIDHVGDRIGWSGEYHILLHQNLDPIGTLARDLLTSAIFSTKMEVKHSVEQRRVVYYIRRGTCRLSTQLNPNDSLVNLHNCVWKPLTSNNVLLKC